MPLAWPPQFSVPPPQSDFRRRRCSYAYLLPRGSPFHPPCPCPARGVAPIEIVTPQVSPHQLTWARCAILRKRSPTLGTSLSLHSVRIARNSCSSQRPR